MESSKPQGISKTQFLHFSSHPKLLSTLTKQRCFEKDMKIFLIIFSIFKRKRSDGINGISTINIFSQQGKITPGVCLHILWSSHSTSAILRFINLILTSDLHLVCTFEFQLQHDLVFLSSFLFVIHFKHIRSFHFTLFKLKLNSHILQRNPS